MKQAINLLQEKWNKNAEDIEYMDIENPKIDVVLKDNEVYQKAIKALKEREREDVDETTDNAEPKALMLHGVSKSFCGCKKPKPNYPEMVWCDNCTKEIESK